jgi:flagellar hook-associated protein 1 FlgK
MGGVFTGLSALSSSQRALDIIGQNIANANTPGYHRQAVRLAETVPVEQGGFLIGTGVKVSDIQRLRSSVLESAVTRLTYESADTSAQLTTLQQVESLISPSEGSVHDDLEAFFNQFEQLASRPDDQPLRRVMLGSATALTDQLNSLGANLDRIQGDLDGQIHQSVDQINALARQIAAINPEIQRAEVQHIPANDQRDQRDQLINELAGLVGVQTFEHDYGVTNVNVGGWPLVTSDRAGEIQASLDASGSIVISLKGQTQPLAISGGKLGGLLEARNQFLSDVRSRLNSLTSELVQRVDAVHATGLGLFGGFDFLAGSRAVNDITAPLAQAGLAFAPQAGSLFISVTDTATGVRTLNEVVIDPATQSLQNVAASISGISHIQALADAQTGTLKIIAEPGYQFDFAGRLETAPDPSGITGTTVPGVSGKYTGASNDVFTFQVSGTGTVGVTPNLQLLVTNSAGGTVASLNIGQGYEPGSVLQVADGVTVTLASGTANVGDTFSTRVIAQPDTAGILPALGLNSFFRGDNIQDIGVRADLLTNPERLGASASGQPGDGSRLRDIAALRDLKLLGGGTQTFREFHAATVGDLGREVQDLTSQQSQQQLLGQRLETERQSISGVDPNEELVHMLQFQRSFQMAARYITAVNQALDELVHIL